MDHIPAQNINMNINITAEIQPAEDNPPKKSKTATDPDIGINSNRGVKRDLVFSSQERVSTKIKLGPKLSERFPHLNRDD